jgi:hypothetical protein
MASIALRRGDPFPDFVNLSFPVEEFEAVMPHVVEYVTMAGGRQASDWACKLGDARSVQWGRRSRVGWLRFSGAAIRAFEASGVWPSVLALVGEYEHRVTGLHAALDVVDDGQAVVKRVWRRALRGRVALTRKRVRVRDVRTVFVASHTGPGTTGTVYLGRRTSDVWAKVYDKRNEILDRCGALSPEAIALNDQGPLTRYELALGRHVGLTLQDVVDPVPVFWAHMGGLLAVPDGVREWVAVGGGYVLPPRRKVLPAEQLELLLDQSHDFRRMVRLADEIGPRGRKWLLSRFARRLKTNSGSDAIAAAVGTGHG